MSYNPAILKFSIVEGLKYHYSEYKRSLNKAISLTWVGDDGKFSYFDGMLDILKTADDHLKEVHRLSSALDLIQKEDKA